MDTHIEKYSKRLLTGTVLIAIMLVDLLFIVDVYAGNCNILDNKNYSSRWKLPETAIDNEQIPQIVIDADASGDMPLPVYRLVDNTYLLYGNIETLNVRNRGFNANAGFIVTQQGELL